MRIASGRLGGLWDWLDPVMAQYERYKAKLYSALADLLGLREQILNLQDRAASIKRRAERTGNPIAIKAANLLADQAATAYREQLDVEQKVMSARDRIAAVSPGGEGVGVLPVAAIAGAVAVAVAAIAAVVVHTQRVNYLKRAMDDLENKLLTTPEYQAAVGAEGSGDLLGLGGVADVIKWAAIAAGVYYGVKMFSGRRARG